MTKPKKCEQVIKEIAEAFADTPRPKNDNFGYDYYEPAHNNMGTQFSKYKHWSKVPFELLHYYSDDMMMWLTDEGFRYMLPAFLTFLITKGGDTGILVDNIVLVLMPPKLKKPHSYTGDEQKQFEQRIYAFTPEEHKAIFAYLECHQQLFGNDFTDLQKDEFESAYVYWYLLVTGDLPKPNKFKSS